VGVRTFASRCLLEKAWETKPKGLKLCARRVTQQKLFQLNILHDELVGEAQLPKYSFRFSNNLSLFSTTNPSILLKSPGENLVEPAK